MVLVHVLQRAVSRINETAIGIGAYLWCAYKEGRNTIALYGNDAAPSIIFMKYGVSFSRVRSYTDDIKLSLTARRYICERRCRGYR